MASFGLSAQADDFPLPSVPFFRKWFIDDLRQEGSACAICPRRDVDDRFNYDLRQV